MKYVRDCYQHRFSEKENEQRNKIWKVLCASFFQKYIDKSATVIDIGSGYCEFINNIECGRKVAVDMNPDIKKFARKDVTVINKSIQEISEKFIGTADIVMMSNFLEHLDSKESALSVLKKANNLLKPGGKIIVLQPNIDLVREAYWNFFDHKLPFNESSLREGLSLSNFNVELFITRFLPYTTKTNVLPKNLFLVKLYLKIPPFLRPFAGMSLAIAVKK